MFKTHHKVELDINEDVKELFGDYETFQKKKHEYLETQQENDEYELCFKICTGAGTKINIPSPILKDSFIAISIFTALSAVSKILGAILNSEK